MRALAAAVFLLLLTSCVLPPSAPEPQVLSAREIDLVSALRRGKDYAQSGRVDLAEFYLRSALKLDPRAGATYNDLGFVLQAQNRFEEARRLFERSLELQPAGLLARDNLARLHYSEGKFEAARKQYEQLLHYYFDYWGGEPDGKAGMNFSLHDLVSVYRNLAVVYLAVGAIDEAICHSQLAMSLGDPSYGIVHHSRFLLAIERPDLAEETLKQYLTAADINADPEALFDYGIALYIRRQPREAAEAFARVSSNAKVDSSLRLAARLMRFRIAKRLGDTAEQSLLRDAILEEEKVLCEDPSFGELSSYAPEIGKELQLVITELCAENGTVS